MELKEFIKTAIRDITNAVSELQNELDNDAVVSPPLPAPIALKTLQQDGHNRLISEIDFDVAVTVGNMESLEGNAGAGLLQVLSAKVNAGNESKTENVSRLTFCIPVIYPTAQFKTDAERRTEAAKAALHRYKINPSFTTSEDISQEESSPEE